MKLAVGIAVGLIVACASPVRAQDHQVETLDDSWIVVLQPGSRGSDVAPSMAASAGGQADLVFEHVIDGFSFTGSAQAAAALARNPNVLRVEPNRTVQIAEIQPNGVERIDGWVANQAGYSGRTPSGSSVRVAILDTGINPTHEDLAANVALGEGKNCINPGTAPDDDHGHGTHVAGSAAAAYNGSGVVGVATDASLVAVKVIDSTGNGSDAQVLCGLDHVAALAADGTPTVINMSIGEVKSEPAGCDSSATHQAICNLHAAGVTVVAAAGNNAVDVSGFFPAGYPETIAVSAFSDLDGTPADSGCQFLLDIFNSCDETLANFTNFGTGVDVAAPGVNVYSTALSGGYETKAGTSMASPHVAGVAALVLGANPALSPEDVRSILAETGECPDGTVSGNGSCTGQGAWLMSDVFNGANPDPDGIAEPLVNALRAAEAAAGTEVDLVDPTVTLTAPSDGVTVTGDVAVSADASDDVAVSRVEFSVDGASIGSDDTAPYELVWNTATVANGARAVSATAYDPSGNNVTDGVTVTVDNPVDVVDPSVTLTAPSDGVTVTGDVTVSADASDDVAVAQVEFFVDGASIGSDDTAPYELVWDTATVANGARVVSATASDPSGNNATDAISVTVDNPIPDQHTPIGGDVIDSDIGTIADTYDGDLGTHWRSYSDFLFAEPWIYWDLGTDVELHMIRLFQSDPVHYSSQMNVQYSSDASSWSTVPEGPFSGSANTWLEFSFAPTTARYWRLWDTGHTIAQWQIAEAEFLGPEGDPDETPPSVVVTAPDPVNPLSGEVTVVADASDDVAVSRVEFSVDGTLIGSDGTAPYEAVWDTTTVANGSRFVSATAFDLSGNTATDIATFDVDNPAIPGSAEFAFFRPSNGRWYVQGDASVGFGIAGETDIIPLPSDYNGDGADELAFYRPSDGRWYRIGHYSTGFSVTGEEADIIPVPGDYDGNGSAEFAFFRPSNGRWYVQGDASVGFGVAGESVIPVPADYDGDGSDDFAFYRPSNGRWYRMGESSVGFSISGEEADIIPVPGDYDGNGSAEFAFYRPSNGRWYVQGSLSVGFGIAGETDIIPLPSDYNGDGADELAFYRPSDGRWYRIGHYSTGFSVTGEEADIIPVPGDYDGNGSAEFAFFRPSNGRWYVQGDASVGFGVAGESVIPVPADYDGDGSDDFAFYRPSNGRWYRMGESSVGFSISGEEADIIPVPGSYS